MSAVVVFILFVICLIIAIPVSISLGIVAVLPGAFDPSFTASASYVIRSMLGGIDSFPLLAVPMFVLAGILMAHGKISQKLFDVFVYFIGKRTAGIPCAVIITCLFYGAISGSAPATVAAVGSMTIPLLIELGYDISIYEDNGVGYYLRSRELEQSEVLLLTDAVYSFPFIPAKQTEQLVQKLQKQLSVYQRKRYRYLTISRQDRKTDNRQVFWNIEQLDEAIAQKKKVRLGYLHYGLDKKP